MMTGNKNNRIAYFISPHGFGHAARAAGVMDALHQLDPTIHFEIFTKVEEWFFKDSISGNFRYHSLLTDIGLVQETPLKADISETVSQLNLFMPFEPSMISYLAESIKEMRCRAVICDIAPLGITIAEQAGIPSILVENFTWDWIYEMYIDLDDGLIKHSRYLKDIFEKANYLIQVEPVCRPLKADLTTRPISRKIRTRANHIRKRLEIPEDSKVVMITMGGIPEKYSFLEQLLPHENIYFIIPGSVQDVSVNGNLILLPHHSDYFHPDLINTSDVVLGKAGYSTLAEIYYGGVPFGYVARKNFRESEILVSFIENHMKGLSIDEDSFNKGDWISYHLPHLLALPKIRRDHANGSTEAARFIYNVLKFS